MFMSNNAFVAQGIERRTSNPQVAGSIPAKGAMRVLHNGSASAFQADSASSILVTRSKAPSSIGQDSRFSIWQDGFDSRWGYASLAQW